MKKVNINYIEENFDKISCLVVGSPKGVGFSTYISEIIAHQIFFNDSYSILVLTANRRERINMLFKIKKAYEYFGLNLLQKEDILYTEGENGSGVCVINYDEYSFNNIDTEYDLIIVDRDDFSNELYENFERLYKYARKLIFNTYDLPDSIYYNLDIPRISISSEYSNINTFNNWGKHPHIINYDRILLGEFKD